MDEDLQMKESYVNVDGKGDNSSSGNPGQEQAVPGAATRDIAMPSSLSITFRLACFFIISAGVLGLVNGISAALTSPWVYRLGGEIVRYCGILVILFGIGAIVSGVAALVMRRISPAFAGAVMGIAGGGVAGFWLGILSLVLLILSDEDL
jgi:hypothetical protein